MTSLAKLVPWRFPLGIELTFVPAKYDPVMDGNYWHNDWVKAARRFKRAAAKMDVTMLFDSIYTDPGCVEAPTIPLLSWKEARFTWHTAQAVAKRAGLVSWEEHQETGMGHIHAGIKMAEAKAIQLDLVHRPYLTWIFATPNGSNSCGNFTRGRILLVKKGDYGLNSDKDAISSWRGGDPWRDYPEDGPRHESHHPHLEFRAFDSAADWRMQEEHLAFIQAYYAHCIDNPRPWPKKTPFVGNYYAEKEWQRYRLNKTLCISEFKQLIDTLGLPWDRYSWYIERNLDPAFEWGDRY
jgi:hypothetical protein